MLYVACCHKITPSLTKWKKKRNETGYMRFWYYSFGWCKRSWTDPSHAISKNWIKFESKNCFATHDNTNQQPKTIVNDGKREGYIPIRNWSCYTYNFWLNKTASTRSKFWVLTQMSEFIRIQADARENLKLFFARRACMAHSQVAKKQTDPRCRNQISWSETTPPATPNPPAVKQKYCITRHRFFNKTSPKKVR